MGKFCAMCGSNVPDNAMNCPNCGAVINEQQNNNQQPMMNQQPMGDPYGQQPMMNQQPMGDPYGQQPMMNQQPAGNPYGQYPMGGNLQKDSNGTISLVCGIIGLLCCAIASIAGLICGIKCLSNIKEGRVDSSSKAMAIVGTILSGVGIVLWIVNLIRM